MGSSTNWESLANSIHQISANDISRYDLFSKKDGVFELRKVSALRCWWRRITGAHDRAMGAAVEALKTQQDNIQVQGAGALAHFEGVRRKGDDREKIASNIIQRVLGDTPARLEARCQEWKTWFSLYRTTKLFTYFSDLRKMFKDTDFELLVDFPTQEIQKLKKELVDAVVAPLHEGMGHFILLKIETATSSRDNTQLPENFRFDVDGVSLDVEGLKGNLKKQWKKASEEEIQRAVNDIVFLSQDENDPANYYTTALKPVLETISDSTIQTPPESVKRFHIQLQSVYEETQSVTVISERTFTLKQGSKITEFKTVSTLTRKRQEHEWRGQMYTQNPVVSSKK